MTRRRLLLLSVGIVIGAALFIAGRFALRSIETVARQATLQTSGARADANNQTMPNLDTSTLTELPVGDIRNCHVIDSIIFASQPAVEDFATFRDMGVTTVLDNRHSAETSFDERDVVENLGMTYVHVPFSGAAEFTDEVLDRSLETLRAAPRPILAHCQACNRTGAVLLAHRVLNDHLDWDDALAEARKAGLHSADYTSIVKDYVERRR